MLIVLIGNKNDLDDKRQVSFEEGEAFAKRNDLVFFETSAKTSTGVEETFTQATKQIYSGVLAQKYDTDGEAIGIKPGNVTPNPTSRTKNLTSGEKKKDGGGCC